jgi:hypothetical protein
MATVTISVQDKLIAHLQAAVESPILINYLNGIFRLLNSFTSWTFSTLGADTEHTTIRGEDRSPSSGVLFPKQSTKS